MGIKFFLGVEEEIFGEKNLSLRGPLSKTLKRGFFLEKKNKGFFFGVFFFKFKKATKAPFGPPYGPTKKKPKRAKK